MSELNPTAVPVRDEPTSPAKPVANPALLAITAIGPLLAVTGVILWVIGANLLKHDQMVADFTHAIGLDNGVDFAATSPQVDADQAMVSWGIALLALGVLLLVSRLIITAVRRPS